MNRIQAAFGPQKAFIAYLTAGDGGVEYCIDSAFALIEGGVDLIELGLPFSDPVADGPIIQGAMQRALQAGMNTSKLINMIEKIRERSGIPIVVFSYYNPLIQAGSAYMDTLQQAGVDGILIVDCAFDALPETELTQVLMASPTTPIERLKQIKQMANGFIYYVCQKGTTGGREALPVGFADKMRLLKAESKIPVAAGFGISSREMVKQVSLEADGYVIGSAIVEQMGKKIHPEKLVEFVRQFRI